MDMLGNSRPVGIRGYGSATDTWSGISQNIFAGVDTSRLVPEALLVHSFAVDLDGSKGKNSGEDCFEGKFLLQHVEPGVQVESRLDLKKQ